MRKKTKFIRKMQTALWYLGISTGVCVSGLAKKETSELLDSATHVVIMPSLILERSGKTKCSKSGVLTELQF